MMKDGIHTYAVVSALVLGFAPVCSLAAAKPFETLVQLLTSDQAMDPAKIQDLTEKETIRQTLSNERFVIYEARLRGVSDSATFYWGVRTSGDEKGGVGSVALSDSRPSKATCEKFEHVAKKYGFIEDLIVPTHGTKFYLPAALNTPRFKINISSSNESEPCIEVLTATTSR